MVSLMALFAIWYIYTRSRETLDYKLGLIAGAALVFCGHYLANTWLPTILDLFFGVK